MANLRKLRTKEHLNKEKEEQSGSVLQVLFFFVPLLAKTDEYLESVVFCLCLSRMLQTTHEPSKQAG